MPDKLRPELDRSNADRWEVAPNRVRRGGEGTAGRNPVVTVAKEMLTDFAAFVIRSDDSRQAAPVAPARGRVAVSPDVCHDVAAKKSLGPIGVVMAHNRKLVLSGIALTMARLPSKLNSSVANKIRNEIEQMIIQADFFEGAPFSWIGMSIRYGLINETVPHYDSIDKEDGELPIAIEIDVRRLMGKSQDEMEAVYRDTVWLALSNIIKRFGLTIQSIER